MREPIKMISKKKRKTTAAAKCNKPILVKKNEKKKPRKCCPICGEKQLHPHETTCKGEDLECHSTEKQLSPCFLSILLEPLRHCHPKDEDETETHCAFLRLDPMTYLFVDLWNSTPCPKHEDEKCLCDVKRCNRLMHEGSEPPPQFECWLHRDGMVTMEVIHRQPFDHYSTKEDIANPANRPYDFIVPNTYRKT